MLTRPTVTAAVAVVVGLVIAAAAPPLLAGKSTIDPAIVRAAPEGAEIVVSGTNGSAAPAVIVLRVDDGRSADYWSRANIERRVPPGPFTFRIPLDDLRTPKGRLIERSGILRVMIFSSPDRDAVELAPVRVETIDPLASPLGPVIALDLGADDTPLWPGFDRLVPGDDRVSSHSLVSRRRPGPDALIGDGIEGVERLTLRPGAGRWSVTLWTDDPGEWEYLPHALERRIRVNGRTILERRHTAERWTREVYLAGRDDEWSPGETAWDTIGARRGGRVSTIIEAIDGEVIVELAGSDRSATFLAAVLIAPADDPSVLAIVDRHRRQRFDETWRIAPTNPDGLTRERTDERLEVVAPETIVAAPGTPAIARVTVHSSESVDAPTVSVEAPSRNGEALPTWPLVGHWRLTRPDTAATLLVPDDRHLRGDRLDLPLSPDRPRRFWIVMPIPASAAPGRYQGAIEIEGRRAALEVEVLDVTLPPAGAAVGLYLDDLPTHGWFRSDPAAERLCAMTALRLLGLTGIAPPLATPSTPAARVALAEEVRIARSLGFQAPLLAYTPLKRLRGLGGRKNGWRDDLREAQAILEADEIEGAGLELWWSAADEVSNHGGDLAGLRDDLSAIRDAAPGIRLAGHLNARRDDAVADAFDAVLVNSGYGLTADRLSALRRSVDQVLLYNLDRPRLAAGAFLWRAGLDGYLQWHALMPTADPFDPTDGREADVSWLPPTAEACPAIPDLDRGLLEMAEGITDLRWLRWLDSQALRNATAAALRDAVKSRLDGDWNEAKNRSFNDLESIRHEIGAMARGLR